MDLPDAQDRRLAALAAAGDDSAFAELVARHRGALVRYVAQRTGRATIAEDAVQEALLSAHRALRRGGPPRDVKAWLHTIAWRRAVDLLRQEAPLAWARRAEDSRAVDGPDVTVLDAAEFERMVRHWRGLPGRQRHALAMSVLEGRSLDEIGLAFGVGPDAAKSLVARSRRSLAASMAESHEACDCRACARSHRAGRRDRRQRALLLIPAGLVERAREMATFLLHNEQPVSLMTKACAGACAVALAGGGSATLVATAPVTPAVVKALDRPAKKERRSERKRARQARAPRPAPTAVAGASPAPVVRPYRSSAAQTAPAGAGSPTAAAGGGATGETRSVVRRRSSEQAPKPYEPPSGSSTTGSPPASTAPQPLPVGSPGE